MAGTDSCIYLVPLRVFFSITATRTGTLLGAPVHTLLNGRHSCYVMNVEVIYTSIEMGMACTASTSQHRATMDVVSSQLKHCLDIELSGRRKRTLGSTEELRVVFGPYNHTSPEVISMYTDSTNANSMIGPFARNYSILTFLAAERRDIYKKTNSTKFYLF